MELCEGYFKYIEPKEYAQALIWEYPRYQVFNDIAIDYLARSKELLEELRKILRTVKEEAAA